MAMKFTNHHFSSEAKRKVQGRCLTEGELLFKEMYGVKETLEEIDIAAHRLLTELLPTADLLPGADKIVKHFHAHNIPMAIATGSDPESYAVKTHRNKEFFESYFSHVVMSGDPDVKHGKPAPDIFLTAASRFSEKPKSPQNVLVFDDALLGIKGALAAEMHTVWIPSIPDMDTSVLNTSLALKSLIEFDPTIFNLPPYPDQQMNGFSTKNGQKESIISNKLRNVSNVSSA